MKKPLPDLVPAKNLDMKTLLTEVKRVSSPVFSPDCQRIAFVLSVYNTGKDKIIKNIWMMDCNGGNLKQLTNSESDSAPCWSEDSDKIAFLSSREGKPQILLIDVNGGEASRITDIGTGVSSFKWSADNKFFIFLSEVDFNAKDDQDQEKVKEAGANSKNKAKIYKNLGYSPGVQYVNDLRPHLFSSDWPIKK